MTRAPNRTTADLSSYPDLVVMYLGMRVNSPPGLRTLIGFGRKIRESVQARPEGLLLHENLLFSLFPPHAGMRQYWREGREGSEPPPGIPEEELYQRAERPQAQGAIRNGG